MIQGVTTADELLHAYLIEGECTHALSCLRDFLEEKLHLQLRGNPDVHVIEVETLTIDDGRRLKALSSQHAVSASPKIFIVSLQGATREAQNALLKLFEEPTPRTHFFLITANAHTLLPTLRSRLHHVPLYASTLEVSDEARAFLQASPAERLAVVKEIAMLKDKQRARMLVRDIGRALYARSPVEKQSALDRELLREIGMLEQYFDDRSVSLKLILEHIALRL
jgi:hypothetical protein